VEKIFQGKALIDYLLLVKFDDGVGGRSISLNVYSAPYLNLSGILKCLAR